MITKERLIELANQKATVYDISCDPVYVLNFSEATLNDFYSDGFNAYVGGLKVFFYYRDMYEANSEKAAEWYKKFGNIKRVDKLGLLPYEEFVNSHTFNFTSKDGVAMEMAIWSVCQSGEHLVKVTEQRDYSNIYFSETLTEESYTRACIVVRELFLEGTRR